jgi:hypothetical protein
MIVDFYLFQRIIPHNLKVVSSNLAPATNLRANLRQLEEFTKSFGAALVPHFEASTKIGDDELRGARGLGCERKCHKNAFRPFRDTTLWVSVITE